MRALTCCSSKVLAIRISAATGPVDAGRAVGRRTVEIPGAMPALGQPPAMLLQALPGSATAITGFCFMVTPVRRMAVAREGVLRTVRADPAERSATRGDGDDDDQLAERRRNVRS